MVTPIIVANTSSDTTDIHANSVSTPPGQPAPPVPPLIPSPVPAVSTSLAPNTSDMASTSRPARYHHPGPALTLESKNKASPTSKTPSKRTSRADSAVAVTSAIKRSRRSTSRERNNEGGDDKKGKDSTICLLWDKFLKPDKKWINAPGKLQDWCFIPASLKTADLSVGKIKSKGTPGVHVADGWGALYEMIEKYGVEHAPKSLEDFPPPLEEKFSIETFLDKILDGWRPPPTSDALENAKPPGASGAIESRTTPSTAAPANHDVIQTLHPQLQIIQRILDTNTSEADHVKKELKDVKLQLVEEKKRSKSSLESASNLISQKKMLSLRIASLEKENEQLNVANRELVVKEGGLKKELSRLEKRLKAVEKERDQIKKKLDNVSKYRGKGSVVTSKADGIEEENEIDAKMRREFEAKIAHIEVPKVKWDEIVGNKAVKDTLKSLPIFQYDRPAFLRDESAEEIDTIGILLYGAPGTGKTLFAKALATASKGTFIGVSASNIANKFYGESENRMRTLFEIARKKSRESGTPSIIFIDEAETLIGVNDNADPDSKSGMSVTKELQICMEGVAKNEGPIVVLAATNHPEKISPAVLSRFDEEVHVELPNSQERIALIKSELQKQKCPVDLTEEDFRRLGDLTDGSAGRDVRRLVRNTHKNRVILCSKAEWWCKSGEDLIPCQHSCREVCGAVKMTPTEADSRGAKMPPVNHQHFDAAIESNSIRRADAIIVKNCLDFKMRNN